MKKRRIDYLRILAVLIVIASILYFYANLFAPRLIPKILRIGVIRRPMNLLLVGTDITFDAVTGKPMPESQGRTDSILMLHFDPVRYRVCILSIPRDSFVEIPGYGWQKINAAHVYGGINLTKNTIAKLTGKNLDYYLEVNPYGVIKLVDLLGGIRIYIEKDMYYVDRAQNLYINLKKGWQKLSGKEAQNYLRFRHDEQGDIGRIARQQNFLQTLFLNFSRPTNLLKVPMAFQIALQNIKTDLPLLKAIRVLNFLRMCSPKDIYTFTASGEVSSAEKVGSIWLLDKNYLEKILNDYF